MPFAIVCKNPLKLPSHQRVARSKLRHATKGLATEFNFLGLLEKDFLCNSCRITLETKLQNPEAVVSGKLYSFIDLLLID